MGWSHKSPLAGYDPGHNADISAQAVHPVRGQHYRDKPAALRHSAAMRPYPPITMSAEMLTLSRGEQCLVSDLSFDVQSGDALWLTGANGTGKTSLLYALAGQLPLDAGEVQWRANDEPVEAKNALAFAEFRGPERDGLTLGEELSFWQTLYGDTQSLENRLGGVNLDERENTPVSGLSAGQRRRLSLARLQISQRPVWLMDEPLAGLDKQGQALVAQLVEGHLGGGGIAIIASHHPIALKSKRARRLVLEPQP